MATELWDKCTPQCGPGLQHKIFACIDTDKYNCSRVKPEKFCGPLPEEMPENAVRACDWGECDRKTWWRVSNWSACSQPCGNLGVATREVECVMNGDDGDIVINHQYEHLYCNRYKKPESRGPCNRFNCPAEFHALEWQKVSLNASSLFSFIFLA